jgi:hypothetical protein
MREHDDRAGDRADRPGRRQAENVKDQTAEDRARVSRLIDEVVRGARIPWRRGREELRSELWTHFEDSAEAGNDLAGALARLGDPAALARGFRHVYRIGYRLCYCAKLAASLVASAVVAVLVQIAVNLRVDGGAALWRLAPGFPKAAVVSIAVALGAVAAWESLRRPFAATRCLLAVTLYALASLSVQLAFGRGGAAFLAGLSIVALGSATSRLRIRPAGLAAAYLAFSILIYGAHRAASAGAIELFPALAMSAALLAVWAASLAILARVDRAFSGLVGQS